MDNILSVHELTERLRHVVEQRFPFVWVRGEVTNCSRPSSGHLYFSLREGNDLLNCVWFRGQQRAQDKFDPLTGEVWEDGPKPSLANSLSNGQEVLCAGRLSVYGPRGGYQLVVELAQETGQGLLAARLEELKRKLAALGYFDQQRKRPLPQEPQRVALVTAPTGAAVRDFIRISSERGLGSTIRIYPSPVQGDEAPPRIVQAIRQANGDKWAQLVVLIRGGGSLEDLWAFNDERVAQAIFESKIPVLTGVGHEIDHSIADFVADRSVATPSHAAQILWPERSAYAQRVDDAELVLEQVMERHFSHLRRGLEEEIRSLTLLSPDNRLQRQSDRLEELSRRLERAGALCHIEEQGDALKSLCSRLHEAQSELMKERESLLKRDTERMERIAPSLLTGHGYALERLALKLEGLSPLAPLQRGYALARTADGQIVRSIHALAAGQKIRVEVQDGSFESEVTALHPARN